MEMFSMVVGIPVPGCLPMWSVSWGVKGEHLFFFCAPLLHRRLLWFAAQRRTAIRVGSLFAAKYQLHRAFTWYLASWHLATTLDAAFPSFLLWAGSCLLAVVLWRGGAAGLAAGMSAPWGYTADFGGAGFRWAGVEEQRKAMPPFISSNTLSKHPQLLVSLHPDLLLLCVHSCLRVSAVAMPSLQGMLYGNGLSCLLVQATTSHNLLNKPIKSQTGLEPAAWGSQQVNPELLQPQSLWSSCSSGANAPSQEGWCFN